MHRTWLAAAAALCAAVVPAAAQDEPRGGRPVPSITVEGQARRDVAPDMAVITLGVVTDRATALEAAQQNAVTVKALIGQIKASGIPEADVQTTQATLSPAYDNPKDGAAPRVRGFHAANIVQIKVRKLDDAGELAGRLIDKGANALQGIDFTVSDPAPVLDGLRAEATRDALRRAGIYTTAAGVKLGRILAIQPEQAEMPMAKARFAAPAMVQAVAVPVQAGTQTFDARVTITWALEDERP